MPTVSRLLEWFSRAGCEDDFRRLCILDALLLNTDRHPGNMGLLVRNATQEVLGMAPVFDFNRALLSDLDDSLPADPGDSVQHRLPWFGRDFIATGRGAHDRHHPQRPEKSGRFPVHLACLSFPGGSRTAGNAQRDGKPPDPAAAGVSGQPFCTRSPA